ncbi:MAG TPA: vanomycin resistance protein VanB [Clostridiaceae bacterium]|nr:vanomycin resistance protein VanB [Clostridiaceae bacterium]
MNGQMAKSEATQPQVRQRNKNIVIIISLFVFILLMLSIASQFLYAILKNDSVYNGVYINNISVGGLTESSLKELLEKEYIEKADNIEVVLKAENLSHTFKFSDIGVSYDIPETIDKAFSIGRVGNIFHRLKEIYDVGKNGRTIEIVPSYNKEELESIVQSLYDKIFVPVKEAELLIEEKRVILRSGRQGKSIDKQAVIAQVEELIKSFKGGTIEIPEVITKPADIDVDDIYKQISLEAVDASATVENNKVVMIPHVMGRKIDKAKLASIVSELNNSENTEKVLPVTFVTPAITLEEAQKLIFRDVLATASTHFSMSDENNRNRGNNIKLASSTINGKILAPGEVFSFNDTVGKRTTDRGYKSANAYSSGKIIEDVGGGICQVSSTLYNAVLRSDLEIVQRRNHSLTVGYVPLGLDATVSYGSVDFKFKNSTRWPIKLQAKVDENNNLIFTVIGTNETPGRKIELLTEEVKVTKHTQKIIEDPSLPAGTTRVQQSGKNGYIINTYKIVKQDGKEISRTKISTSVYNPLEEIIIKGTKPVPVPADPPANEQKDNNTESGSEENPAINNNSDNQPADGGNTGNSIGNNTNNQPADDNNSTEN